MILSCESKWNFLKANGNAFEPRIRKLGKAALGDSAEFARYDPKGFLRQYPAPLIIDEAQRVPELIPSLQVAA